mgnify:FL=1
MLINALKKPPDGVNGIYKYETSLSFRNNTNTGNLLNEILLSEDAEDFRFEDSHNSNLNLKESSITVKFDGQTWGIDDIGNLSVSGSSFSFTLPKEFRYKTEDSSVTISPENLKGKSIYIEYEMEVDMPAEAIHSGLSDGKSISLNNTAYYKFGSFTMSSSSETNTTSGYYSMSKRISSSVYGDEDHRTTTVNLTVNPGVNENFFFTDKMDSPMEFVEHKVYKNNSLVDASDYITEIASNEFRFDLNNTADSITEETRFRVVSTIRHENPIVDAGKSNFRFDNRAYPNGGSNYVSDWWYYFPHKVLEVNKVWDGVDLQPITINLLKSGNVVDSVVLDDSNEWKHSFVINANDNLTNYTIEEVDLGVEYVESSVSTTSNGTYKKVMRVTNKYINQDAVTIRKAWKGTNAGNVEVELLYDGDLFGTYTIGSSTRTIEVPRGYDLSKFSVNEIVPEGYRDSVSSSNGTYGNARARNFTITNEEDAYTDLPMVTDCYIPYVIEKIDITVDKDWVNGPEDKDPVEVQLYRDGEPYGDPVTLGVPRDTEEDKEEDIPRPVNIDNEDSLWSYTWQDLDDSDETGHMFEYTVEELEVPENYVQEVIETEDGFTIRNTYVSPKIDIEVFKEWIGGPEDKPEIEIQLYRNGEEHGDPVTLGAPGDEDNDKPGPDLPLEPSNINNNGDDASTEIWSYVWTDLDKTDEFGVDYKYTVDEVSFPENYDKGIDGFTITNRYRTPFIGIQIEKEWVGGPEDKPDIEVQLYRNGEPHGEPLVLPIIVSPEADPVWKAGWLGLEETDVNGNEYVYTISEVSAPENYTNQVIETEDGYKIINTYVSPKRDITVTKEWIGGPEVKPDVEITLLRDGQEFGAEVLTLSDGEDSVTWTDLDETDENGRAYVYSAKELTSFNNYTPSFGASFTDIVNTYKSPKTDLEITKIWIDGPEERPDITLQLVRNGEDYLEPFEMKNGDTTHWLLGFDLNDENGNPYVYTVREITELDNYIKEEDGLTVTNIYQIPKRNIEINKVWDGGETLAEPIEVELYKNGELLEITGTTIVLDEGNDWKFSVNDLEATDIKGNEHIYTIKEKNTPDNFTASVNGFTITNTYTSPKINIEAEKDWIGGPEEKPEVHFQLYRNGEAHRPIELVNSETNTVIWKDLDKTDESGVDYVYTVDEVNVPENYIKEVDGLVITNTYVSPRTSVRVDKEWVGGVNHRPDIDIQLYQDGEPHGEVTLTNGDTYHIFSGLDETDENGVAHVYTVDEINVPENFRKEVDGFKITNTYVSPKTEITVNKDWVGGPEVKPNIDVQLYRDGEPFGEPVTITNGQDSYTWTNLDERDEFATLYTYTVDEVNVPENFVKKVDGLTITNTYVSPKKDITINKTWVDGELVRGFIKIQLYRDGEPFGNPVALYDGETTHTFEDLDVNDSNARAYNYTIDEIELPENFVKSVNGFEITNTYVSPKTNIEITKVWIDGPEERPAIDIQLYRNGVEFGEVVTIENGQTEYVYEGLDATDSEGKLYKFTVDEVNVPEGYIKDIDGLEITNTYQIEKVDIKGQKIWVGGPSSKPTIQVQLLRNGEPFREPVNLYSGETSFSWLNLDKTDKYGVPHIYTVDELDTPENYEKSLEGLIIRNTYVSPKRDVTMTKTWINGPAEKEDIEVQLYRNGEPYGDTIILPAGQTNYTWIDLDKTDFNGKDYVYTVDEVEVPEYYIKETDGLHITNTFVGPKINIAVEKEWINGPEEKPVIEIQLYRDGEPFGEPVALENGETFYRWHDLAKTDEFGRNYLYTVDEVEVPANYVKEVDGFKITNTYVSPKIDIEVTKEWVNGPEEKPSIEIQLYRDGETYGDPVILENGETSYVWEELDATDINGREYIYTVDELDTPENYEKEINGLTIVNKYISPLIDITVNKEWIGGPEEKPTIKVQLYRNGLAIGEAIELEDGVLTYTWTDLDKTDHNGVDYVYTVEEFDVPEDYESEVDGFNITNTYVKEEPVEVPEDETPEDKEPEKIPPKGEEDSKPEKPNPEKPVVQTSDDSILGSQLAQSMMSIFILFLAVILGLFTRKKKYNK